MSPPSFRLLDFTFAVDCPNPALTELLCHVYSPFRVPAAAPAYVVTEQETDAGYEAGAEFAGEPVTRTRSRAGLFSMVLWDVNRRVALASGRSHLLLHAAAAAAGDAAVLLSAPTESGKSTLVTALVEAGLDYLTDEFVAVDAAGLVRPVPKAIGLDPGSWPLFPQLRPDLDAAQAPYAERQWQVLVQQWRPGQVRTEPARPAAVVLPRYRAGEPTRLEPVSRAAALLALADQTFEWPAGPVDRLHELAALVREAACYRLTFSDLGEAVESVRTVLSDATRAVTAQAPP